jgi:SAM-dependent methyltransferase
MRGSVANSGVDGLERNDRQGMLGVRLRCPVCKSGFRNVASEPVRLTCSTCGFVISEIAGIVRALSPDNKSRFERFVCDYRNVRTKEGWGSLSPEYYLALPFKDLSGKHGWIWRIRARTLLSMQNRVLPNVVKGGSPSRLRILDIGAGNGWLSYRLARVGHFPVAVDLLVDDRDGLGAAQHYLTQLRQEFPRFQAEMDSLPFESGQFDVAIFNASFHYSADYETTLREVMRCLRDAGLAIIADTPFYWRDESGRQMLKERRAVFEKQFGVRSDGLQSGEYLTPVTLDNLAKSLGIQWHVCKPWYGWRWAFRPVKARLLCRREPSKFHLFWFQKG